MSKADTTKPVTNINIPIYPDIKVIPSRSESVKKWELAAPGAKLLVYWIDFKEWREAEVVFQWKEKDKLWIHIKFQNTVDEQLELCEPKDFNRVVVTSTPTA